MFLQSSPRLSTIQNITQTVNYLRVPNLSIADEDAQFQDLIRNERGMSYELLLKIKQTVEKKRFSQALKSSNFLAVFATQTVIMVLPLAVSFRASVYYDHVTQAVAKLDGETKELNSYSMIIASLVLTSIVSVYIVRLYHEPQ